MLTRRAVIGATIAAGAAPRSAWGKTEADVIVIGAGLAGLNAARLLEAGGQRVILVEGSRRIGGRAYTLDDLPGHPEAGAVQVGSGYARLRRIAGECGIGLIAGGAEVRTTLYRVSGITTTSADWATSAANRLAPRERMIEPAALGQFYSAKLPRLDAPAAWADAASIAALDRPLSTMLREAGAGDEALRLIGANFNGTDPATMSALHIARSAAIFRAGAGPVFTIAGGSQRLPEAMAKALRGTVRLGAPVTILHEDSGGAGVTLAGGQRLHARHVICTIPFSAMHRFAFDGIDAPGMGAAIATLATTRASFAYLAAKTPFWKTDGLPATLWTDEALLGRVFVLGDQPPMLKLWVSGRAADALDALGDDEAATRIMSGIEAARPSAKGQLRVIRRFSWSRQPFARGIYHHIGAGHGALLAAAVRYEGKRVHFAGEHLALSSSGMEGALESGERVARLILSRG
jgi:monoamine oxidase